MCGSVREISSIARPQRCSLVTPNGGERAPAIRMPGYVARKRSCKASSTCGVDPKRKWRSPAGRPSRSTLGIRSGPGTRCEATPNRRCSQATGAPSGKTIQASSSARRTSSWRWTRPSTWTLQKQQNPPEPASACWATALAAVTGSPAKHSTPRTEQKACSELSPSERELATGCVSVALRAVLPRRAHEAPRCGSLGSSPVSRLHRTPQVAAAVSELPTTQSIPRTATNRGKRIQRARHLPDSFLKTDEAVRQIHFKSLNSDHSVTYK